MDWTTHMRRILARLGEDATFAHAGGEPETARVVFISPYARVFDIVSSSNPQIALIDVDVTVVDQGDTFILRSYLYTVKEVKPDPVSGVTVCELEQTANVAELYIEMEAANGFLELENDTAFELEA